MTDPITRLNSALEGRYRVGREIGEDVCSTFENLKGDRNGLPNSASFPWRNEGAVSRRVAVSVSQGRPQARNHDAAGLVSPPGPGALSSPPLPTTGYRMLGHEKTIWRPSSAESINMVSSDPAWPRRGPHRALATPRAISACRRSTGASDWRASSVAARSAATIAGRSKASARRALEAAATKAESLTASSRRLERQLPRLGGRPGGATTSRPASKIRERAVA